MEKINIDESRYQSETKLVPLDSHYGVWTFLIDSQPVTIFGTYGEAKSQAKLFVRLSGNAKDCVELDGFSAAGQIKSVS